MRRIIFAAAALLAAAPPALAVLRPPDVDIQADTLELLPDEAQDFRFRRLAGHDLSDAGLFLALASVPLAFATPFVMDRFDKDHYLHDPLNTYYLLGFALLPAASSLMAAGNLVYGGAARYHTEREFAITRSALPLVAFGLAAGKAFWIATHPDPTEGDFGPVGAGLLIGFALTELYTLPALRNRFKAASYFLDQVRIRVAGQGNRVGLVVEF